MAGIYLHIPFCRKACSYCDFYFSTHLERKDDLVSALVREMKMRSNYLQGQGISSVYFGGGTPSVLNEKDLGLIFENILKHFSLKNDAEITLEANPDDLDSDYLHLLRSSGINRLSIGLQSFIDEELKWMRRTHSAGQNEKCIALAREAGFTNLSVDLIYGSRFQSMESWKDALNRVEEMNVQHLSCYNLTVEEKTILGVQVKKGKENIPDEELSARQFEYLMEWSERSCFAQYEISNFAKEGFISRHNSSYWLGAGYIGLGPSAHSFNGHSRQWNISSNVVYIQKIFEEKEFFEIESLDEKTKLNEYVLTRLRTKWGLDIEQMAGAFPHYFTAVEPLLQKEIQAGNLFADGNKIFLSKKGKLLADRISSALFIT